MEREVGVGIEDFGLLPKAGLRLASDLGFRAVELATVQGELSPKNLPSSARRHLKRFVEGLGLRFTSLSADLPHLRLTDPQSVSEYVDCVGQVLDVAADMGVGVVTSSVGALTHPETKEPSTIALDALRSLGARADTRGVTLALRFERDGVERMASVISELSCPSIGICFDPAVMVMSGHNPLTSIEQFVTDVRLLHVRDATAGFPDQPGREVRLGEGNVDVAGVLAVLDAAGFAGAFALRRRDSANAAADLGAARTLLCSMLPG